MPTAKRSWNTASVKGALALATLFAVLVVGSRPFGRSGYNEVSDHIRRLGALDSRLDEAVLLSRFGLRQSYDELVDLAADSDAVMTELRTLVAHDTRDEAIAQALAHVVERHERQTALIERFKSVNAVLINSLAFLPVAAADVATAAQKGRLDARLVQSTDALVHGALESELPTQYIRPAELQKLVDALRPSARDPSVQALLAHAEILIRYRAQTDALFAELLAVGGADCYEQLYAAVRNLYDQRAWRGNLFRIALTIFCLLLMAIVARMFYQLRVTAADVAARRREVEELNAELEQRVAERTRAVSDTNALLRAKMRELTETRKQLSAASRQSGMAEVASSVLHNVGNVLNSVNVSAMLLREAVAGSKTKGVARVAQIFTEHQDDLADFVARDERGRKLPAYLHTLAGALAEEQGVLLKETDALRRSIDHIKVVIARQQQTAKASGVYEQALIGDIIDDAVACHDASLERHGVELVRDYADLPRVTVDRHRLIEILVNLVGNARHAVAAQPVKRITVRTRLHGSDRCLVEVEDTGYGIDPVNLVRIFNHGFTTKPTGHGFGLHGSACVAGEMGGRLTVHSDGVGQGACFRLELPLIAKSASSKAA